ncbi:MAG: hypothetical protein HY984_01590 [Candidatus Magasanikbacteria bacterium]|nr:hypothetical protein [Candidatus Magasanikbacteria bacterium]
MSPNVSRAIRAVENPKEVRSHPSFYGNLKDVKRILRNPYKPTGAGKNKPTDPAKPLSASQVKRIAKIETDLQEGNKLSNTDITRKSLRLMGERDLLKERFKTKPGSAIVTANAIINAEQKKLGGDKGEEALTPKEVRLKALEEKRLKEAEERKTRRQGAQATQWAQERRAEAEQEEKARDAASGATHSLGRQMAEEDDPDRPSAASSIANATKARAAKKNEPTLGDMPIG